MNNTQPFFEISLRPTAVPLTVPAEPQLGLRKDIQSQIQPIRELINSLLTQLDLLQYESVYADYVPCLNLREEVRRFEMNLIQRALTRTHGSQVQAARLLRLNATTLNAKLKRYRLKYPYSIPFEPSQLNEPNTESCKGA